MGELDYAGTNLVAVRRFENGVQVTLLSDQGPDNRLTLTSDEWDDLVHLAVLFIRRARGEL